jgi:hypothetical protein
LRITSDGPFYQEEWGWVWCCCRRFILDMKLDEIFASELNTKVSRCTRKFKKYMSFLSPLFCLLYPEIVLTKKYHLKVLTVQWTALLANTPYIYILPFISTAILRLENSVIIRVSLNSFPRIRLHQAINFNLRKETPVNSITIIVNNLHNSSLMGSYPNP